MKDVVYVVYWREIDGEYDEKYLLNIYRNKQDALDFCLISNLEQDENEYFIESEFLL